MARQKSSPDRGAAAGYNFATGAVDTNPPATPRNPNFSKMPAMKPMPSHPVVSKRPGKRAVGRPPVSRALTSGGR